MVRFRIRYVTPVVAALGLGLGSAIALSDDIPNPFPAQNATQCGNAGGVFSQEGSSPPTNICVVTTQSGPVLVTTHEAGNSDGFVREVTETTVTTYTRRMGSASSTHETTTTAGPCINPGGQEVPGHIPACQP